MFEVQQITICDGWVNTWINWDDNGNATPETFKSFDDAVIALDEYLSDIEWEYKNGNLDSIYDRSEFRIVKCDGEKNV